MCVYLCACMHVHAHIRTHTYIYTYDCNYTHAYMHACTDIDVRVHTNVYTHASVYTHISRHGAITPFLQVCDTSRRYSTFGGLIKLLLRKLLLWGNGARLHMSMHAR